MKDQWYKRDKAGYDRFLLAGDVGGTNTNLGLVGVRPGGLDLLHELEVPSKTVEDFPGLVARTAVRYEQDLPGIRVEACSIGANGPVKDNYCHIHNLAWQIDGEAVRQASGLPTMIVNDFTSVSYALPFVDTSDPNQAVVLHSGSGPQGDVRAVIGAGTGMGVGALLQQGSRYLALPSEGGHIDFAPFDSLTESFRSFVEKKIGTFPSVELCCSGIGLRNLFLFAKAHGWLDHSQAVVAEVDAGGLEDAPRIIAKHAPEDAACRRILDTFVRIYARFASNIAATLLPRAGLYLAGGIGSKNLAYFTERDLFRKTYLQHNNPVIRSFLEQIPVVMIMNYNTALIGAANAGLNLL
jgi:glucokinase